MLSYFKSILLATFVLTIMTACNTGPKVISSSKEEDAPKKESSGIFSSASVGEGLMPSIPSVNNQSFADDLHTVVVDEILPTSRYVYLHVQEGDEKFWIATGKQEIEKGGTYYYRDGLLKTNFESKEHNRVFDKIYLVSKLVGQNHGGNELSNAASGTTQNQEQHTHTNTGSQSALEGSLKIAKLVKNPQKYKGKTVQISGKCVKVNPNIMGRNWIHIQDGSKDDFDLVITTNTIVQVGDMVTMRATVGLDVDFGAGYKYDLILENGEVVK